MKLLFDQNISFRLIKQLQDVFPDSAQVRSLGLENKSDKQIWEYARARGYSIVTFDADYYDFSLVWGHPPKIIWVRTSNQTSQNLELVFRKHHKLIREFVVDSELACLEIINAG